jgi:hypothetical protein
LYKDAISLSGHPSSDDKANNHSHPTHHQFSL